MSLERSKAGGIVVRGGLLDYVAYAQRLKVQYTVPSCHGITQDVLESIAKEQKSQVPTGKYFTCPHRLREMAQRSTTQEL